MFEINGIIYANEFKKEMKVISARVTDYMMMIITFSTGEKRVFDAFLVQLSNH